MKIYRELWIQRRKIDDTFEADSRRIDFYKNRNLVKKWGSVRSTLNYDSYDISRISYSALTVEMHNYKDFFGNEEVVDSFWYGYLTRIFTRCSVKIGTDPENLTEVFVGFLRKVTKDIQGGVKLVFEPPQYILNKFSVTELGLSGEKTCEDIIIAIFDHSILKKYITTKHIDLNLKLIKLNELEKITGTFLSLLKKISLVTNSFLFFKNDEFYLQSKTKNTGEISFKYKTIFTERYENKIFKISNYDDEGYEKTVLRFATDEDPPMYSVASTTDLYLKKYLGLANKGSNTTIVSLKNIENSSKNTILTSLLGYWEKPRKSVDIEVFFNIEFGILKVLDLYVSEQKGAPTNVKWDSGIKWGDGSKWGGYNDSSFDIGKSSVFSIQNYIINLKTLICKLHLVEI